MKLSEFPKYIFIYDNEKIVKLNINYSYFSFINDDSDISIIYYGKEELFKVYDDLLNRCFKVGYISQGFDYYLTVEDLLVFRKEKLDKELSRAQAHVEEFQKFLEEVEVVER